MPARARLRALAGSTHPGPGAAVTVIAGVLGVAVGLPPERVVLLVLAVAANQASVGLSNDWIDADRDRAVGRRDKPVARGDIAAGTVRAAAFAAAAAAVLLTIPLGAAATAAHVLFIASAWAYNAGLKSTALSVLPYVVGFGVLPGIVTLALPSPALPAPWAAGVGALLGIAAHLANVLPDLDDDRATGVRGLPHRLGRRISGLVVFAALAAAAVLAFAGLDGAPAPLRVGGLVVSLLIAVAGVALVLSRPPTRLLFQLIIAAALVDVAVLAAGGPRLLA